MTLSVLILQLLNGLQFGVLLFLMSAGLTLVLGIMRFVNLSHGSFFMLGAYFAAAAYNLTGTIVAAVAGAILGTLLVGLIVQRLIFRRLAQREHLYQVLGTFGLILIFNEAVTMVWGSAAMSLVVPSWLSQPVFILGLPYSSFRFAIIAVGMLTAVGLYVMINKSRIGIMIRASASNSVMANLVGINAARINAFVICLGAALAGAAGLMAAPISAIQSGMGEPVLILALVVIVVGGIGSVRGAFYGAVIVGVTDTLARTILPAVLNNFFDRSIAQGASTAISSLLIYLLMAVVLAARPAGLFPVRSG